uniref:Integrase catalytic domain-containing protein n=1 Tax=Mesocestoides corti TaxID=53468 RepID=A0A5K3FLD1_MESCO
MLLLELCDLLGIHRSCATAYHSQGNGQAKRTNRTLKILLRLHLDKHARNQWDDALPACLLAYRSAVHFPTGLTPAAMTVRHELRRPADIVVPPPRETDYVGPSEYFAGVRRQLHFGVSPLVEGEKHSMVATSCDGEYDFRLCGVPRALNDAPGTEGQSVERTTAESNNQDKNIYRP